MSNLGRDFKDLKARAYDIPEVNEYLQSFSVIIGDLVLARRMQMGLTQSELASLAKTTQATISRIEAGDDGVKTGTLLNNVFKVLRLERINPEYMEDAVAVEVSK